MNRMKALREEKGLTMREAAKQLNMPYTTYVNYEKGVREPNSEVLILIATFYETSIDYLLGKTSIRRFSKSGVYDNILPMPEMRRIPLLGTIACGEPILAEENLDGEVDIPAHVHADFALRCKGDSMITARIFDGDIVYIRRQDDVANGDIAAVLIGDEATLKRVYKYPGRLELRPENPTFPVLQFEGPQLEDVRIIGKAVAFTSPVT